MNVIVDESKIIEASVLMERARVLSSILANGYFEQDIESPKDFWKLAGFYYDNARVITETVSSLAYDAEQLLNKALDESIVKGGALNVN